ncbi:sensor domain-containing diguanylate cyclase [Zobellella maritima]|uniref:sensor domain-containing diguanylate cyclase n=1 Tax=Zobellella maritima TaxID=2059725 RepID=UPI001E3EECBB|nr:sensor domain-containing diguanylate cyclase [Zobellella maritima]
MALSRRHRHKLDFNDDIKLECHQPEPAQQILKAKEFSNNPMKILHLLLRLDLRRLILILTIVSVLITLLNSVYATYQVQRELLINNTLEANRVYAAKLAETTDTFLKTAQSQLKYSASLLATKMDDEPALLEETRRLHRQTNSFNSVIIVNADAMIVATSPATLQIKGIQLTSPSAIQSLDARQPLVTDPFLSVAGNYLISISHPIFATDGRYLGFVAGSIYLQGENILNRLLGQHHYKDGSYIYVVDRHGVMIYHLDQKRIGEQVTGNPVIAAVIRNQSGTANLINSHGTDMLAGFAPVPLSGWGVVAQRPSSATLAELDDQIRSVFIKILPLALLTLLFIWCSALLISRPLWQLAKNAREMDQQHAQESILAIRSWYFESALLKRAILKGVGLLNDKITQLNTDSHTDPMTGLYNRRGMQKVLDYYQEIQQPFAIIALDIDHFKGINDRHGHDTGDQVIKSLAQLMRNNARKGDALCRSGGEEFLILLPDTGGHVADNIAERLRQQVALYKLPAVSDITISLGVAYWPGNTAGINESLKRADRALYQAKRQGRNQVVVATEPMI